MNFHVPEHPIYAHIHVYKHDPNTTNEYGLVSDLGHNAVRGRNDLFFFWY